MRISLRAGLALTLVAAPIAGSATAQDAGPMPAKLGTCTTCHGRDGMGTSPLFPNLAGQSAIYMIAQLEAFRSGARQNENMAIVARDLTDQDIRELSEYYERQTPACP